MGIFLFIGTTERAEKRLVEDPRGYVAYWVKRRQYTVDKVEWISKLQVFENREPGYVFIGYMTEEELRKLVIEKGSSWNDVLIY